MTDVLLMGVNTSTDQAGPSGSPRFPSAALDDDATTCVLISKTATPVSPMLRRGLSHFVVMQLEVRRCVGHVQYQHPMPTGCWVLMLHNATPAWGGTVVHAGFHEARLALPLWSVTLPLIAFLEGSCTDAPCLAGTFV